MGRAANVTTLTMEQSTQYKSTEKQTNNLGLLIEKEILLESPYYATSNDCLCSDEAAWPIAAPLIAEAIITARL